MPRARAARAIFKCAASSGALRAGSPRTSTQQLPRRRCRGANLTDRSTQFRRMITRQCPSQSRWANFHWRISPEGG
eukprot:7310230-Pyramimonas_sp.AAC.1